MTHPDPHSELGMNTAEYAVGTVAVCTGAMVLCSLGTNGFMIDLLHSIFGRAADVLPLLHDFPGPLRFWLM